MGVTGYNAADWAVIGVAGGAALAALLGAAYSVPWRRANRRAKGAREFNVLWRGRAALALLLALWAVSWGGRAVVGLLVGSCRRWVCSSLQLNLLPPREGGSARQSQASGLPALATGLAAAAAGHPVGARLGGVPAHLPRPRLDGQRLDVPGLPDPGAGRAAASGRVHHAPHVHLSREVRAGALTDRWRRVALHSGRPELEAGTPL